MDTLTNPAPAPVAAQENQAAQPAGHFSYLPVALFGSVMGLSGLAVAWHLAQQQFGAPAWVAQLLGGLALLAFAAQSVAYAIKLATSPAQVKAEFMHPIAGNMFGTPLISLMLLPVLLAPFSLPLARALWFAGALGMTGFAWLMVTRWMTARQKPAHATPVWIVPVVGLLDIPLTVPALALPGLHGVAMFGLAIGLFFAVPLFTLIFSRLLFEEPMPQALQPSLLILVAPFAVGFSAYVATMGQIDAFAQALYMVMLFLLAVLLGLLRHLPQCCPFRVSWWGVSFPLAASAAAALRYAGFAQSPVTDGIALGLLALASLVIAGLLARTLAGIARGELKTLSL